MQIEPILSRTSSFALHSTIYPSAVETENLKVSVRYTPKQNLGSDCSSLHSHSPSAMLSKTLHELWIKSSYFNGPDFDISSPLSSDCRIKGPLNASRESFRHHSSRVFSTTSKDDDHFITIDLSMLNPKPSEGIFDLVPPKLSSLVRSTFEDNYSGLRQPGYADTSPINIPVVSNPVPVTSSPKEMLGLDFDELTLKRVVMLTLDQVINDVVNQSIDKVESYH